MLTKSFIAQSGQSIFDLAYMAYGDSQEIIKLKGENPGIDINGNNYSGTKINYTPVSNVDRSKQILTNSVIATGSNYPDTNYLEQENGFFFDLEDGSGKIELEN